MRPLRQTLTTTEKVVPLAPRVRTREVKGKRWLCENQDEILTFKNSKRKINAYFAKICKIVRIHRSVRTVNIDVNVKLY